MKINMVVRKSNYWCGWGIGLCIDGFKCGKNIFEYFLIQLTDLSDTYCIIS